MPERTPKSESVKPIGWNAKLVDWFLHNTKVAILLFIMLVLGGAFALANLRSEGFPLPQINLAIITTVYRGASLEEVET
jgi:multidrug efflux pump subunit AcrB